MPQPYDHVSTVVIPQNLTMHSNQASHEKQTGPNRSATPATCWDSGCTVIPFSPQDCMMDQMRQQGQARKKRKGSGESSDPLTVNIHTDLLFSFTHPIHTPFFLYSLNNKPKKKKSKKKKSFHTNSKFVHIHKQKIHIAVTEKYLCQFHNGKSYMDM